MNKIIQGWIGRKVLLVGDVGLDRWWYGTAYRMSPESPFPVLLHDKTEESFGMAGLVASMVAALGGQATLVATANRPLKTRILGRVPGREYHDVAPRLDQEATEPINDCVVDQLLDDARTALLDGCTAILLCDYRKGTVTQYLCQGLQMLAGQFRVPIAVDAGRGADWSWYRRMIVKANAIEWATSGLKCGLNAVSALELPVVIITHGAREVEFFTRSEESSVCVRSVEGVDPTGCGDQFMAVLGLYLASLKHADDVDVRTAIELCVVAGSMQVQRHGCKPVTSSELQAELAKEVRSSIAA